MWHSSASLASLAEFPHRDWPTHFQSGAVLSRERQTAECKLCHLGSLLCNSLCRALEACTLLILVVSVYTLSVETAVN